MKVQFSNYEIRGFVLVYIERIDATVDDGSFGRLLNHAWGAPKENAVAVAVKNLGTHPRLLFKAVRDIESGEELQYDYGERREDVIRLMPWLAKNYKQSVGKFRIIFFCHFTPFW